MIWHPKAGQIVRVNYKDKAMPYQGYFGIIRAVGKRIKNCLVEIQGNRHCVVIPRGNLNADKLQNM